MYYTKNKTTKKKNRKTKLVVFRGIPFLFSLLVSLVFLQDTSRRLGLQALQGTQWYILRGNVVQKHFLQQGEMGIIGNSFSYLGLSWNNQPCVSPSNIWLLCWSKQEIGSFISCSSLFMIQSILGQVTAKQAGTNRCFLSNKANTDSTFKLNCYCWYIRSLIFLFIVCTGTLLNSFISFPTFSIDSLGFSR